MHAARESRKGARLRLSTQEGKTEICLWFFYWHMLMWNLCYMHICAQLRLCVWNYMLSCYIFYTTSIFLIALELFCVEVVCFLITLALLFLVSKTLEGEACERIRNPDHTEKSKKEHLHLAKNWSFSVLTDFTTFACMCKKMLAFMCVFLSTTGEAKRSRCSDDPKKGKKDVSEWHTWHLMSNICTPFFFSFFYSFYVRR